MRRPLAKFLLTAAAAQASLGCGSDRAQPAAPAIVASGSGATATATATSEGGDAPSQAPLATAEETRAIAPTGRNAPPIEALKAALEKGDKNVQRKVAGSAALGIDRASSGASGAMAAYGAVAAAPARDLGRGEGYQDYGQNAWTDTSADRLSTFAADVDTASFTIARRKLREGALPPTAAVRVEEFVNYFKYGYDTGAATSARPFTVSIDAATSPFATNRHIVRVGVATAGKPIGQRPPANLTFLVDVSGSMSSPDKLGLAQRSLRLLVDSLKDGDRVSLVTYAGSTRVVLPSTGLDQKDKILAAIEDLRAGGSTAMASGIQLAYAEAAKSLAKGTISRVLILSDGDANVGATHHNDLLGFIEDQMKRGVTLSTVGFGQGNYQDTTMEQLANRGNGNAFYIDSLSQAKRVFAEQLGSTLEVVAQDVKLQVEFDPQQVKRYRLVGYENRDIADAAFRDDKVDAGEIGAGHQVTAVYEVELTGTRAAAPLATVRVRHKAPGGSEATEHAVAWDGGGLGADLATASADLRLAFAVAAFADVLRGGADAKTWDLRTLRAIAAGVASDADRRALVEMIDQAIALRGGGASTPTTTIAE